MNAQPTNRAPHMGDRHLIDAATFELSFGNRVLGRGDESDLARIVETELMSVVDEVFDDAARTTGPVRLDYVEVDLGSVWIDDSWESVRERLRGELRSALATAKRRADASVSAGERTVGLPAAGTAASASSGFRVLEHFLRFGTLSPIGSTRDRHRMVALLDDAARSEPQRLAALVRAQMAGSVVITRIVRQFADPQLGKVAGVLDPRTATMMERLVGELKQCFDQCGSGTPWETEVRPVLWSQLLTRLAAPRPPDTREMVRAALQEAARGLGRPYDELVVQIAGRVVGSGELAVLLRSLAIDEGARPGLLDTREPGAPNLNVVQTDLRTPGRAVLDPPTGSAQAPDVPSVPGADALVNELVNALEHRRSETFGILLEKLKAGEIPLADLIGKLSMVGHRRLLGELAAASGQSGEGVSRFERAGHASAQSSDRALTLYQQALKWLGSTTLADRDTIAAAGTGSVGRAAPGQKTPAPSVGAEDAPPSRAAVQDGALVRHQVAEELADGGRVKGFPGSKRLFRAYDLYELLARAGGRNARVEPRPAARAAGLVEELAHIHPDQLHRICLELQSGVLTLSHAVTGLSTADLCALVEAYLSFRCRPPAERLSEFARSIESYARRSRSERAFYGQLLERLVADELVDLEAIAAGSASLDGETASREVPANGTASRPDEQSDGHADDDQLLHGPELGDAATVPGLDEFVLQMEPLQLGTPDRFLERLRSGELSLEALSDRLTTAGYRRLLARILGATSSPPGDGSAFGKAIEAHARRSHNQREFYRQVLERLVADELVDLEGIAAGGAFPGGETALRQSTTKRATGGSDNTPVPHAPDDQILGRPVVEGASKVIGLDVVLDELEHRQLETSDRWLERLRSGELPLRALSDRLSTLGHRRLLSGILAATAAPAGDGSAFRKAIEAHARRSGNERAFYRRVLRRLVANEVVDLEAIAAEAGSEDGETAFWEEQVSSATTRANELPDKRPSEVQDLRRHELVGSATVLGLDEIVYALEHRQLKTPDRLLQRLRSGEFSARALSDRLSTAGHRSLLAGILGAAASPACDGSAFCEAMEDHARRSGDERAFYRRVLERLVADELVDLEALAAGGGFVDSVTEAMDHSVAASARDTAAQSRPPDEHSGSNDGERALLAYLRNGGDFNEAGRKHLVRVAEQFLGVAPTRIGKLLRESLQGAAPVARLVELLPERLLTRALFQLAPPVHELVQRNADAVANACYEPASGVNPRRIAELKWRFCFQYLLDAGSNADAGQFVQRFTDYLAVHSQSVDAAELRELVRESLADSHRRSEIQGALPLPGGVAHPPADRTRVAPDAASANPDTPYRSTNRELLELGIRIGNSGLVLAAPYLPRLLAILGLIADGSFRSPQAQDRAIHLLQFMADGSSETEEHELVLNKLLCGVDTATPVTRGIVITADEREAVEGLIRGMIQNWKVLGKTSVSGFRESFLRRNGTLRLQNDGWTLSVEQEAFDLLLDRIPWGFSTIKHSWMNEVIHVDWR